MKPATEIPREHLICALLIVLPNFNQIIKKLHTSNEDVRNRRKFSKGASNLD
jgi:hypothetical protein